MIFMRALSASELLAVWERGFSEPSVQRALILLGAACSEYSPDALSTLSIGSRDARLFTLREWMFGPQLVSVAICLNCAEQLEVTFNTADLRIESEFESTDVLSFDSDGYLISFRTPNSLDLASVAGFKELAAARIKILERCISTAERNGEQVSVDQLPTEVVEQIVEQMERADPQADMQVALTCPACGHQWQTAFDIVSFLWAEINAWAIRTLKEVHTLASAYGWRESDILNLNPWRRQFYINLVYG